MTNPQDDNSHAISNGHAWIESMRDMIAKHDAAEQAEDFDAVDEAREEIESSPLSVQVRSEWYSPGDDRRTVAPDEFEILLSTGGPALRIIGELDEHCQPVRPRVQWQDWFKPWTDLETTDEQDTYVEAFCAYMYFGE